MIEVKQITPRNYYFITCYADFKGYAVSLFELDKTAKTLALIDNKNSNLVSNVAISKTIQEYLDTINKPNINNIGVIINENKTLNKHLIDTLKNYKKIFKQDFEIEESFYNISVLINEETLAIAKHLLLRKNNIITQLKNADINIVNHNIYSLFLALNPFYQNIVSIKSHFICSTINRNTNRRYRNIQNIR